MPSTQSFLPIQEVRDGVIILKNGEWRGVLMTSSINFGLLSSEEQEAVIYQFQNFLNSLDFHIQILVQSRRLNISGYIKSLKEIEAQQESELLRIQAREYREFIESLSEMVNLMEKHFYVIFPFYPKVRKRLSDEEFQKIKKQFEQRAEFIATGLRRTGINCVLLGTEEILELLWSFYNPKSAEKGEVPIFPKLEKEKEEEKEERLKESLYK